MTNDPEKIATIIDDRTDWLIDAIATSTQNRTFLRGEPQADLILIDAILMNGAKAIRIAIQKITGLEIPETKTEKLGASVALAKQGE